MERGPGGAPPSDDDTIRVTPRPTPAPVGVDEADTITRPPAGVVPAPVPDLALGSAPGLSSAPENPDHPSRFRLRLADGGVVDLDAPVYVGRRPARPRIHSGPEPRLVTVPSPAREVSATHLELRVVGSSVVASDMLSTNGTALLLPGGLARTLIRGESAVVPPGTVIDLGDGNRLEILAPA